jgi:hypothetical protein
MHFLRLFTGLLPLLVGTSAFGALGDTESQCLEKYGLSVKQTAGSGVGDKLLYYDKAGVGIGAEFWNGRAACMFYKKTLSGAAFSDAEIDALLKENKEDSYWERASVIGEGRKWVRKDGRAVANYLGQQHLLIVMTDSFALQRMRNKQSTTP